MITRDEIDLKAAEFEILPANVERDYVFGWLLYGLFTQSELKDKLFLKGGNALRKGYFANTRYSYDLDFGIPDDIDQDYLLDEINKICEFIEYSAQVNFIKAQNKIEEKFTATNTPIPGLKVYEARVYFKDFYGKSGHVKIKIAMDITRFDKVLLPLQTVELIHPYSDALNLKCEIKVMKLEEIIATKLKCMLQREHVPDLFDYVYTIQRMGGQLDKTEVVQTLIKKTIFEKNPLVLKNILIKTSFDYFKEYWGKALICATQHIFSVEDAISLYLADLEALFSIYSDNGYAQFAYFGPEFRVPIMKAGRNQTLLKVRYKGEDRLVEPYALKYLQRRDGVEREYFYVYNREGGDGSPGIRCFVSENVQSIENTDEKFTPREQIELSKAGELGEKRFLFDPNRPQLSPNRIRRVKNTFGVRYIYQCNVCGRRFTKTISNNSLRAHKSKSGYACGGTYGIYINTVY